MTSVSCCSGGVMFVPDEIERKSKSISYKEFVKEEKAERKTRKLFGRRKEAQKTEGTQKASRKSA